MSNGFDDWVAGKTGWEWLTADPYAEARAFYGEAVFQRIYEQEQADRKWALVRREADTSGRLVDDVAGQVLDKQN